MVDSTDRVRMCVAKEELEEVLKHDEASNELLARKDVLDVPVIYRAFL